MILEVRTTHLSKSSWANQKAQEFEKKISRFEKIQFKVLKDEEKLVSDIAEGDRLFICDERGDERTSKDFAKDIQNLREGGIRRLILIVGGPFGVSEELRKKADKVLSLSNFVMNQEVALVVLMEQLFRAYTIINNHPYHNE